MDTRYGYALNAWEHAREEIRQLLIRTARSGGFITYTDLCKQISAIQIEPHEHALRILLGGVSTEEHEDGRPLLTALIIYKNGEFAPGTGFFNLAESLGYEVGNTDLYRDRFWLDQLRQLRETWPAEKHDDAMK